MRNSASIVVVLGLAGALAAQAAGDPAPKEPSAFHVPMDIFDQPPPDPNRAVATVNGRPIRAREFERAAQLRWSQLAPRLSPADRAKAQVRLVPDTLEQLIQIEVLRQAAESAAITATPEELTAARQHVVAALPSGTKIEDLLKSQQLSAAEFEGDLADQIRIGKFLEKAVQAAPPVTEQQARAFYQSHPGYFLQPEIAVARQILFRVATNAPAADREKARQRAEDARKRALAGEDFGALIKALSEAPAETREKPVSMIRGQPKELRALERAMFEQPLNVVSAAVESPLGLHLVRVEQRAPPRTVPFEEVREKLTTELGAQTRQRAADDTLRKLRQEAKVVYEAGFGPPTPAPAKPAPPKPPATQP